MTKTAKIITWSVVGVASASLIGLGLYVKSFYDKISFTSFAIDKSKINLQAIAGQLLLNNSISIPAIVTIENKNNESLTLRDVKITMAYEGIDVAKSDVEFVRIPANTSNFQLQDYVELFANTKSVRVINELIAGRKPEVDVTISAKLFNIPTGSYTFKQTLEF